MKSSRVWLTPEQAFKMAGLDVPPFVTFNPSLKRWKGRQVGQYDIVRAAKHDGTAIFTAEIMAQALLPISQRASYFTPEPGEAQKRFYEVGPISLATVYHIIDLPAGRFHGERQRVRVPVKCYYK